MQICKLICFLTTFIVRITLLLHHLSIKMCIIYINLMSRKQQKSLLYKYKSGTNKSLLFQQPAIIPYSAYLRCHRDRQQWRPHLCLGGLKT